MKRLLAYLFIVLGLGLIIQSKSYAKQICVEAPNNYQSIEKPILLYFKITFGLRLECKKLKGGYKFLINHKDHPKIYEKLNEIPEVKNIIPILETQVLVMGENQSSGALVRGVSPETLNSLEIISSNILMTSQHIYIIIGKTLVKIYTKEIVDGKMGVLTVRIE